MDQHFWEILQLQVDPLLDSIWYVAGMSPWIWDPSQVAVYRCAMRVSIFWARRCRPPNGGSGAILRLTGHLHGRVRRAQQRRRSLTGDPTSWQADAVLNYQDDGDYAYRAGYRRAGDLLSEYAINNQEADYLVFPICHAYRHFVELSLKRLIMVGCSFANRSMTASEKRLQSESHNLIALWTAFKGIQIEASKATGAPAPRLDDVEGIESYINQLHTIDARSQSFRYPLKKDGTVALATTDRINLARFSGYMEWLANYFEGFEPYYAEYRDLRNQTYAVYVNASYLVGHRNLLAGKRQEACAETLHTVTCYQTIPQGRMAQHKLVQNTQPRPNSETASTNPE